MLAAVLSMYLFVSKDSIGAWGIHFVRQVGEFNVDISVAGYEALKFGAITPASNCYVIIMNN